MNGQNDAVLWDRAGKPLSVAGALVAPHALNVAQVYQLAGRLYSYRWDEAMRDAPANALAMRRDAFYRSLIQERIAPTVNTRFEVQPVFEDNQIAKLRAEVLNRAWDEVPDRTNLLWWLLYARTWYGRGGQQGVWDRSPSGLTNWVYHEPVNGDSLQYTWDAVPVVLVSFQTAQKYRVLDPDAVVNSTDRGAFGLKLHRPEYRRRFIILQGAREACDYYEGEMAGGVHGTGVRSWVYWNDYIRRDVMAGTLGFLSSFGTSDVVVFNFPAGNPEAQARAEDNAKKMSGKVALLCPRDPAKDWPAVEQVSMNAGGVEVMMRWLDEYSDRHIRELIVGQTMSSGGGPGGLEGDGRAELAKDTKYQLCETDCHAVAEALSRDWLLPAQEYNFPGEQVPLKVVPKRDDPKAKEKVENAKTAWEMGVSIEVDEIREAMGFRKPRPGKEVLQKKPDDPDPFAGSGPGGPGERPPGQGSDEKKASDFFDRFTRLEDQIATLSGIMAGMSLYRATQPPWPGAVFDERSHRWRNPDGTDTHPAGGSGRAASSFGDDHDVALKPDVAAAVVQGIEADVAAMPEGRRPPPALVEKAKDVALTVAAKAYAWALHASHSKAVGYLSTILGEVFDLPSDMAKLGYNPNTSSGTDNPKTADFVKANMADAIGFGISGHMVASIASKVLVKAAYWVKAKFAKKAEGASLYAAEESDGFAEWADLIAAVFAAAAKGMGDPNPTPDAKTVEANLRAVVKSHEDRFSGMYEARQAPAGGVTVQGTEYKGGQFIPGSVMAKATPAEKADVRGGASGRPKAEGGRAPANAKAAEARPDPKSVAARPPAGMDVARSRRVKKAHAVEAEVARAMKGVNLPDSEPADVMYLEDAHGQPVHSDDPKERQVNMRMWMKRRRAWLANLKELLAKPEDQRSDGEKRAIEQYDRYFTNHPAHAFEVKTLQKARQDRVRMTAAALAKKKEWEEKYGILFHVVVVDERKGQKHSGHRVYVAPNTLEKTVRLGDCKKAASVEEVLKLAKEGW